ncbi:PREDICTED: uncharacterized protein LOC108685364 [Atta colombica]|uniref:uncharacterized protein LOC108685364 n=1 Tax=Atta colombica TaxID=520822 RepID=UPI00084CAABB|nr:PREDICTED: uncharacterized protein LOC108685364 [Atta colombica]
MRAWFRDIMGMKLKMEDKNSKQFSNITDSTVPNNASETDFDEIPTTSISTEEYTPSSVSVPTTFDIEHRYQLVGNINIINQMEVDQDVLCICYTETYDFLAAGLLDGNVKFYKVNSGENTLSLCDTEIMLNPSPVTAVKHRPVRSTYPITNIVIATLYLYDEETKTLERVFRGSDKPDVMDGHKSRVFSACFNPKSAYELISGGWDDTIHFWDTRQAHSFRFISGAHICGDGLDISTNGKEILTCSWQRINPIQLWDYGSGKLITTVEPDSYSSLLYAGKYVTNMYIACGGCDVNLFRIVDLRSHSTIAMIRNLRSGMYSLDFGPLESKYSKRILPKFAFSAGTTIFEVEAQPE